MIKISQFFLILLLFISPSKAAIGPINVYLDDVDPLEELNRPIFEFNQTLDQNLIEPIAISYRDNTPESIKKGVSNFFSNLGEVSTLANQILQFSH
jgi:phospholipid-binding lipoprotein MlaA